MSHKSPFFVIQEFISPLSCEEIVDNLRWLEPDYDEEQNPLVCAKMNDHAEEIIFNTLRPRIQPLETYYGFQYQGMERPFFEWYVPGTRGEVRCENSNYLRKKWLRVRMRDLTGVLFMSDYQDKIPFDNDFEVYGGKLEFPQHQFGFNPQRGTLIVFPSDPHFLNAVSEVLAGELHIARFHIAAMIPYIYQPTNFPGDYTKWFAEFV
jgi:hypothetical protein